MYYHIEYYFFDNSNYYFNHLKAYDLKAYELKTNSGSL